MYGRKYQELSFRISNFENAYKISKYMLNRQLEYESEILTCG
jgi:hypothetical protein